MTAPTRRADRDDRPLLPVDAVRDRILAAVGPLASVDLSPGEALGGVLAADIRAEVDLPPFDSSAMDGFALRAADVAGAAPDRPVELRTVPEVRMGRPPETGVGPGEAAAVPTGGMLPPGADAIVPIERCAARPGRVLVLSPAAPGDHVRPAAEDLRRGGLLVPAGRRLQAPDVGLLASAGVTSVPVHPPVRVAVLSTGDELVPPGGSLGPGQVHDANASLLAAAVREAGGVAVELGAAPDDPGRVVAALDEAAPAVDVLLSSGGVAVGARDPVRRAFAEHGAVDLYEVAMQPGKPQAFGTWRGRPFFGLPGNPVSVFVSFEVFVRPALLRMMGRHPFRPRARAVLEDDVAGLRGKTRFARVRLRRDGDRLLAAASGGHGSNLLAGLAGAGGLAVIPAGAETLPAGSICDVLVFRDPEDG